MLSSALEPKTSLAIAGLLLLSLSGCGDSGEPPAAPEEPTPGASVARIVVLPSWASIDPGDTSRFVALPFDWEGRRVFGVTVTWSSSDEAIATVDSEGLLTAVRAGDATILAAVAHRVGTATVHVFTPVRAVSVSPDSTSLAFGETLQLTAAAFDSAGGPITDRAPAWSVLDTTIARVNSAGVLTGIEAGQAEIVARVGNAADTAIVKIRPLGVLEAVAISENSTCGLTAQGRCYCWGANRFGELGIGSPGDDSRIPRPVAGGLIFRSIVGTANRTYCALTDAGEAYCWGSFAPSMGAAAIAACGGGSSLCTPTPSWVAKGLTFESIAMGYTFVCGITAEAEAYCWGGSGGPHPQRVPGDTEWTVLTASDRGVCGLDRNGAAYCWGPPWQGDAPRKVTGDLTFRTIDTGLISGSARKSCGITGQDALYCWGGDLVPEPLHPEVRWQHISLGVSHACGIATDGTALCWGDDTCGQLGNGTFRGSSDVPVAVVGGHPFVTLTAYRGHTCATEADGAFCWGSNFDGELGTYAAGFCSAWPVRVAGQE